MEGGGRVSQDRLARGVREAGRQSAGSAGGQEGVWLSSPQTQCLLSLTNKLL